MPWVVVVVAWSALVLAPDILTRRGELTSHGAVGVAAYALLALAGLAGWVGTIGGIRRTQAKRPALALAWTAAVALAMPLAVVGALRYRAIVGRDVPPSAVTFFLRNPSYGWALFKEGARGPEWLMLASGPLALGLALHAAARRVAPPRALVVVGALAASLLATVLTARSALTATPDLTGAAALGGGAVRALFHHPRLQRPQRVKVADAKPARAPDVLLFLHESLGAAEVAPWNGDRASSPEIADFLASAADRAVWFPRASPTAGATDVSVPSILTGLGADASLDDYTRAPLVWQDARALGYRTALLSAQGFEEARFSIYFLGPEAPDVAKVAEDWKDAPRTVDTGVDEGLVADEVDRLLGATPKDTPLFVVVQTNATHIPCYLPGDPSSGSFVGAASAMAPRCKQAVRLVSAATGRVLEAFRKAGRLEETLVLHTADHGETFRDDRPPRVESYFEDVLRVPLFVALPRSLATKEPGLVDTMRANAKLRASNVDLVPTILDVWGRWPTSPSLGRPALAGASLLRPLDPLRPIVVVNTNEIRGWSREGYALFHGDAKWTVDDLDGVRLFDLAHDEAETRPVHEPFPPAELAFFREQSTARPVLRAIASRVRPDLVP